MERRYAQRGQSDRFVKFFEAVKQTLYPEFVTPHGYNTTFINMEREAIFLLLNEAIEPLVAIGKPVILYAGALLGYVRDGKLIAHDDDVDFAIYLGKSKFEEIRREMGTLSKVIAGKRTAG